MDNVPETPVFNKKYLPWIVLALLVLFGGYLRVYHLDYPVVGYHNWKETHYLTEARNFEREGFFAHGLFIPAWDLPFLNEDPAGSHADTFPTISILGAISFKIFGEELWAARGIGVLLNIASIILFYLIIKRLFKREDLALTTAALFAMNPLMIFFSRNFQLDSPALFFMLLGTLYLFKWLETDKNTHGILAAAFLGFGVITKYSFVVMLFPLLAVLPWKRVFHERKTWFVKHFKLIVSIAVIVLACFGWFAYTEFYFKSQMRETYGVTGGSTSALTDIISLTEVFTQEFRTTMHAYFADNFTLLGITIAFLGFLLLLYRFIIRRQAPALDRHGNWYMVTYGISGLLFTILLAHKLGGHSYHQFPYAPLVVFLIAYLFVFIAGTIAATTKIEHLRWVVIVGCCLFLWYGISGWQGGVPQALERQFGTQFPGLDVAGEFIKLNSESNERILHSSHQSYGVLWHADRKGYKIPGTVAELQKAEAQGATWLFIYQWRFDLFQDEKMMEYIRSNYRLRQVGFTTPNGQFSPIYFLLQKGGTFDETKLNDMLDGQGISTRAYTMPGGGFALSVITLS
jgi:hypothetical protein